MKARGTIKEGEDDEDVVGGKIAWNNSKCFGCAIFENGFVMQLKDLGIFFYSSTSQQNTIHCIDDECCR